MNFANFSSCKGLELVVRSVQKRSTSRGGSRSWHFSSCYSKWGRGRTPRAPSLDPPLPSLCVYKTWLIESLTFLRWVKHDIMTLFSIERDIFGQKYTFCTSGYFQRTTKCLHSCSSLNTQVGYFFNALFPLSLKFISYNRYAGCLVNDLPLDVSLFSQSDSIADLLAWSWGIFWYTPPAKESSVFKKLVSIFMPGTVCLITQNPILS